MSEVKHTPRTVTEADVASAREYLADVHNATQMLNACAQLRPEVVRELAARRLVPSHYRAAIAKAEGGSHG
jgi:hypothetical protein